MHAACQRASTIYFFELETTRVVFISKRHAFVFPIILSLLLAIVYFATRRAQTRKEREAERDLPRTDTSFSTSVSRKVSRTADLRPIFETPVYEDEGAAKLRRMLSDIEEQQDVMSISPDDVTNRGESEVEDEGEEENENTKIKHPEDSPISSKSSSLADLRPSSLRRGSSEPPGEASKESLPLPQSPVFGLSAPHSRKSSLGSRSRLITMSRRNSFGTQEIVNSCDLYKELGQIDLLTYLVNAVNVFPSSETRGTVKRGTKWPDVVADLFAVHIPVWACVAALHVVLLELISVKLAFYFYYHEETMQYAALCISIVFGLLHEFAGGWMSSDVLALSSIYVVVSRIQLVSYQTGVILSIGLICFDLFFLYVVDMLSTVTGETKAPLMLVVPRDNKGGKQSLATLDIMAPGVFLNLLLKFNAMYDPKVYALSSYAVIGGFVATFVIALYRRKITPALVLPLLALVATSLNVVDRPFDLWRFMIKH